MTPLTNNYHGIVAPGDAQDFFIDNYSDLSYFSQDELNWVDIDLPPGKWSIVGTVYWKDGELKTDFDAALVVDKRFINEYRKTFYRNYSIMNGTYFGLVDANDSLASILDSKGLYFTETDKILILTNHTTKYNEL